LKGRNISPEETCLSAMYRAFNARDLEAVVSRLSPSIRWPNAWEGRWLEGREAVRRYWTRQWAAMEVSVTPTRFETLPDGQIRVTVHQTAWDLGGTLLSNRMVTHTYQFSDGLVTAMVIGDLD
jgi:ketosteroid isomerase-like protein